MLLLILKLYFLTMLFSLFTIKLLAVLSAEGPQAAELISEVYRSCLQGTDSSRTTPRQTKFLPLIRMAQAAFEHIMVSFTRLLGCEMGTKE